jgi:hypothetical protein
MLQIGITTNDSLSNLNGSLLPKLTASDKALVFTADEVVQMKRT